MSYTLLSRSAADATWQGKSAYTLLARNAADAGWSIATVTGLLSAPGPLGQSSGVATSDGRTGALSAHGPLGDVAGLASVAGVVAGDLRAPSPLGDASGAGTPVTVGVLADDGAPQPLAGFGHCVVRGTLRGATVLGDVAGYALHAPSIDAIRGQTVTRYRAILRAAGYSDLTLPIANFQARAKYGDQSYLLVTIPAADQYASAITDRADGELSVEAGATFGGVTHWAELLRVTLNRVRADIGPRRYSMTIDGYQTNAYLPSDRTLAAGNYDRSEGAGRSYRLPDVDFNVRPGDRVTLHDSTTLIVGSITYTVSAAQAAMELNALTDADLLAGLPW